MAIMTTQRKPKQKYKPFRYVLPVNATPGQKRRFRHDLASLKAPDSSWAVYHDWKQPGEVESYIIIPKGQKNYDKAVYAGIRIESALSRFNEKMRH